MELDTPIAASFNFIVLLNKLIKKANEFGLTWKI
jgi:hypothetical protein